MQLGPKYQSFLPHIDIIKIDMKTVSMTFSSSFFTSRAVKAPRVNELNVFQPSFYFILYILSFFFLLSLVVTCLSTTHTHTHILRAEPSRDKARQLPTICLYFNNHARKHAQTPALTASCVWNCQYIKSCQLQSVFYILWWCISPVLWLYSEIVIIIIIIIIIVVIPRNNHLLYDSFLFFSLRV